MKGIDGAMRGLVNVLLALEPLSKDERKRVLFAAISALDELDNGTSSGATGPSPNAPRHIDFVEDVDHDFVYDVNAIEYFREPVTVQDRNFVYDVNAIGDYFRELVTVQDRNPKYPFVDDMD